MICQNTTWAYIKPVIHHGGLYSELVRLVSKAVQLKSNSTTNLSECYMSIRAKINGGERINCIKSEHHCMEAGLSLTLGPG